MTLCTNLYMVYPEVQFCKSHDQLHCIVSSIQHKSAITPLKILAMCIGFAGVIIVAVSDVFLALNSNGDCHFQVSTTNLTSGLNNSAANQSDSPKYIPLSKKVCTKYTTVQVGTSLIALLGGSFMWSISSGKFQN